MTCSHTQGRWRDSGMTDYDGEPMPPEWVEESACEDISTGAYRCTRCGKIGYYTGGWRDHHENGAPSPAEP